MKAVASMIGSHFDGIIAWTQTRQTNGFIEALNGLFEAPNAKPPGIPALTPCVPCCSSSPASSTSPPSTLTPPNPLHIQKGLFS
jgi:hypothetical protein